jgi:hypothetical protein
MNVVTTNDFFSALYMANKSKAPMGLHSLTSFNSTSEIHPISLSFLHLDIPDYTDPCSGHIDPSKNGFGTVIC